MGRYDEAIKCFEDIISHQSQTTEVLYNYALNIKAMALANKGKYEDVYNWSENNLVGIDESYVLDTRAFILLKLGRYEEAEKLLNKAITKEKKDKFAWYHRGNVFAEKKKYDSAVRCNDKALEIDPEFSEALNDKAVSLSNKEKYNEAIQELKKQSKSNHH